MNVILSSLLLLGAFFCCCPAPLRAQQDTKKQRVLLAETIYFGSGSDKVEASFSAALRKVIAAQSEHKESKIWIHAHTDSIGGAVFNEALSAARATSVEIALAQLGADTSRMNIRHYGAYSPLADNRTEKGRAENRRVAVYVIQELDASELGVWGVVRGQVRDAQTQKPLQATLIFNSLQGRDSITTDSAGNYALQFSQFANAEGRAYCKGYFFVSKVVKPLFQDTVELNFSLERALLGGKLMLTDLYFQAGTAELLPSSKVALEGIYTFLAMDETLKIEIGGHINKPNLAPIERTSPSFRLSEERARSVYNYLIERGIPSQRLTYKGYGNWEMIHPQARTELEEQLNRRVELKVTE